MTTVELTIDLGRFEPCINKAIGPGRRAGIWVRGCPFRCPDCCSTHFQQAGAAEDHHSVGEIISWLQAALQQEQIEGVTFSGGEPFAQAPALAQVAASAHKLGLTVMAWSGYTLEELRGPQAPIGAAELLAQLDVLIDGRYDRRLPVVPFRGSTNQRIHLLTDRYTQDQFTKRVVVARLEPDGTLVTFGILPPAAVVGPLAMLGVNLTSV